MMRICLLLSFLFLYFGGASTAAAGPSCRSLFRQMPEGNFDFSEADVIKFKIGKREIARVELIYNRHAKTLFISWIEVKDHQGQGLSNALIEQALIEFPDTVQVAAYLTDSNYRIFLENYNSKKDLSQALISTPFYKSLSSQGFDLILDNHLYDEKVIVLLARSFR